jgi:hydrogenase/urease accessory protein HupE
MTPGRRILPVALAILVLARLALTSREAGAHEDLVTTSDVEVGEDRVVWRVDVDIAALERAGRLHREARSRDAVTAAAGGIGRTLAGALQLRADGRLLAPALGALDVRTGGDGAVTRVVQTVTFPGAAGVRELRMKASVFADVDPRARSIVRVHWRGHTRAFVRAGAGEIAVTEADLDPSTLSVAWEFLRWGVHHIFVGYDHIAFLIALLLATASLRELIKIVTAFTLAHSVTLCLAGLGLLRIPTRISEALIAASIVYVAVENLRAAGNPPRHRALLAFSFGLVHGLGFATELRARLLELGGQLLVPVVSFNVGVEIGQVAIVALVFPALSRLRSAPAEHARRLRQRRLMKMGSVPILLLGLFWLVDRLLG